MKASRTDSIEFLQRRENDLLLLGRRSFLKGAITSLLFLHCLMACGQGEHRFWYFGMNAGLDFSNGIPVPVSNGRTNTNEGSATISDSGGNLLFYTAGDTVFDATHSPMPNGAGMLGGLSSVQSSLIVPSPSNPNQYYLFTTNNWGEYGCHYSIVDMTLNNGKGDVTAVKNVQFYYASAEKITAIPHTSGQSYWIIIHSYGIGYPNYLTYLLDSTGLAPTPIISAGLVGVFSYAPGYLRISPNGNKMAAIFRDFPMAIEIADFDRTTGQLSNFHLIPLPGQGYQYGVEFSPNSRFLYVPISDVGSLYQYDMFAGSPADIEASATAVGIINVPIVSSIARAPNGKLYLAEYNRATLGVVEFPDSPGVACLYQPNQQPITGSCFHGLPNFFPGLFCEVPTPTLPSDTTLCDGDSILLTVNPMGYDLIWHDSTTADSLWVTSPGTYHVTLSFSLSCRRSDTIVVSPCVGIEPRLPNEIKVGPVPAQDHLRLTNCPSTASVSVTIRDLQGRICVNKLFQPSSHHLLEFKPTGSGVYLLSIETEGIVDNRLISFR